MEFNSGFKGLKCLHSAVEKLFGEENTCVVQMQQMLRPICNRYTSAVQLALSFVFFFRPMTSVSYRTCLIWKSVSYSGHCISHRHHTFHTLFESLRVYGLYRLMMFIHCAPQVALPRRKTLCRFLGILGR